MKQDLLLNQSYAGMAESGFPNAPGEASWHNTGIIAGFSNMYILLLVQGGVVSRALKCTHLQRYDVIDRIVAVPGPKNSPASRHIGRQNQQYY